mmetsp:Transcript_24577/g.29659  ORF Transcript_24577/g.29659 Transcript_24577/m.29659 type:complete len:267 (+) Transcript_24577:76-876(+)
MMNRKIRRALHVFTNKSGANALCSAIIEQDWKSVMTLCQTNPEKAKSWRVNYGFYYNGEKNACLLPIHMISALNPPEDVLLSVINAYPKGIKKKDSFYGRAPIHIACLKRASVKTMGILLSYYCEGAAKRDKDGRIPLHYACSNQCTVDIVRLLLNAYPDAAKCFDMNGWLPIHVACNRGSSIEVIEALLTAFPESVLCMASRNLSPLMLAQSAEVRRDDIVSLLEMETTKMKGRMSKNGVCMVLKASTPNTKKRGGELDTIILMK